VIPAEKVSSAERGSDEKRTKKKEKRKKKKGKKKTKRKEKENEFSLLIGPHGDL
jgi:hypothetical protein